MNIKLKKHQETVLKKVKTDRLYPYQRNAVNKLHEIMTLPEKKAFIQMPTGSGKTYSSLTFSKEHCLKYKLKSVIWVVHQTNLYIQAAGDLLNDFKDMGGKLLGVEVDSNGNVTSNNDNEVRGKLGKVDYIFMTWQKLRNMVDKNQIKKGQFDFLIIDEAHYGSSENQLNEHKSFKKIFASKLFDYHLYISATLWDLNPAVFKGLVDTEKKRVKDKFLSMVTLKEVMGEGLLNDVDFMVINSADTVKLKSILSGEELDAEGSSEVLAGKVKKNKVDVSNEQSKYALQNAITSTLLSTYFEVEDKKKTGKLPPTIIFCAPERKLAEINKIDPRCEKEVIKKLKRISGKFYEKVGGNVYRSTNGKDKDSLQTLQDFKDGKFPILIVTNMAQEGFNYKGLEVAIDLNPNYDNTKRWTQKIGRLTRKEKGKGTSRYYYADTLTNYIYVNGVKCNVSKDRTALSDIADKVNSKNLTPEVLETIGNTAVFMNKVSSDETGLPPEEVRVSLDKVEKYNIDPIEDGLKKLTSKKISVNVSKVNYIITEAKRVNKDKYDRTVKLSTLVERSNDFVNWNDLNEVLSYMKREFGDVRENLR